MCIALIYPHLLSGRKTPTYLLTYPPLEFFLIFKLPFFFSFLFLQDAVMLVHSLPVKSRKRLAPENSIFSPSNLVFYAQSTNHGYIRAIYFYQACWTCL